jgi:hypothetical protein
MFHVHPPPDHVCGHHEPETVAFELIECLQSVFLEHARVDADGVEECGLEHGS